MDRASGGLPSKPSIWGIPSVEMRGQRQAWCPVGRRRWKLVPMTRGRRAWPDQLCSMHKHVQDAVGLFLLLSRRQCDLWKAWSPSGLCYKYTWPHALVHLEGKLRPRPLSCLPPCLTGPCPYVAFLGASFPYAAVPLWWPSSPQSPGPQCE